MSGQVKRRGIWFDPARGKWRVRIYRKGTVIHLSYHTDPELAEAEYHEAKARQQFLKSQERLARTHSESRVSSLMKGYFE